MIASLSRRQEHIHKTNPVKAKMNAQCAALTGFVLRMVGNQAGKGRNRLAPNCNGAWLHALFLPITVSL